MPSVFRRPDNRPLVLGHRGVPHEFQENSLAGFRRAVELGVDGVELDVQLTADNRVAVFHDGSTKRLTGEEGSIQEMTWEQVSRLRIRRSFSEGRGQPYDAEQSIPLLEEVLEETKGKLVFDIELKATDRVFADRHIGRGVAEVVERVGCADAVVVTSFNPFMLQSLLSANSRLRTGFAYSVEMEERGDDLLGSLPLVGRLANRLSRGRPGHVAVDRVMRSLVIEKLLRSDVVNLDFRQLDATLVRRFKRHGLGVGCFTFFSMDSAASLTERAEGERIRELSAAGVEWMETDDPVRLLAELEPDRTTEPP